MKIDGFTYEELAKEAREEANTLLRVYGQMKSKTGYTTTGCTPQQTNRIKALQAIAKYFENLEQS